MGGKKSAHCLELTPLSIVKLRPLSQSKKSEDLFSSEEKHIYIKMVTITGKFKGGKGKKGR